MGTCQHTLTGHTSLVGLLGLSPSYLVSAAADSTLRIWDPDSGELQHTLAAHTGAITCFQHDEFKVLSGSDGNLKMWNVRDGSVVRDLLTGITGVWQVVFEGRWCVAASNRNDATVLDVWDFGHEADEEWVGEPAGGIYDEDDFSEDEDDCEDDMGTARIRRMAVAGVEEEEQEDAMDQDVVVPSDIESVDIEIDVEDPPRQRRHRSRGGGGDGDDPDAMVESSGRPLESVEASRWAPSVSGSTTTTGTSRTHTAQGGRVSRGSNSGAGASVPPRRTGAPGPSVAFGRTLPMNDETPTRPRVRGGRRR